MKQLFFVGTYTEPILFGTGEVFHGKGKGVYLCEFEEGEVRVLRQLPCSNPSFLCVDEEKQKVYAVNEKKEYNGQFGGSITQISYAGGGLKQECVLATGGADPCHIALAPNGGFLSVANFASGSVSVFYLDDRGNLTGERSLFEHTGASVHPVRQRGPHAHATVFCPHSDRMLVPDLGTDQVKAYRYTKNQVVPAPELDLCVPAGSGPRTGQCSADGRFFYLLNEISSQVMSFTWKQGKLVACDCAQTLPPDVRKEANICSDLHIDPTGRFLYAANRGHNSLCCYQLEENGALRLLHRIPCGGKTPRNFAIDPTGRWLLVGNQDSDAIALFMVEADGGLTSAGVVRFPSPVCICFLNHG